MTQGYTIASIDAGKKTGIAIAHFLADQRSVTLRRKILISTEDIYEVVELVRMNECAYVVMERKAAKGSQAGIEPYERIFGALCGLGFEQGDKLWFQYHKITLVSPGIWKPFMKATNLELGGKWCPEDSHQSDALKMLYYAVKLNNMSHKVRLG